MRMLKSLNLNVKNLDEKSNEENQDLPVLVTNHMAKNFIFELQYDFMQKGNIESSICTDFVEL
ncbi:hypothetical protein X975_02164, partial [Stegodyphus mimosarum]